MTINKRTLIFAGIIIALLLAPLGWWLASPLWRTDAVDEAFPFDLPTVAEAEAMPDDALEAAILDVMNRADEMTAEQQAMAEEKITELAEMMPDEEMAEEMPEGGTADEWAVVASGTFVDADALHQGTGTATIFQQGEQRVLRFEDFEVTNGPDLHVLLVQNADGGDPGEYVDLGQLKGNVGNQNYEIPADIDLSQYDGIMIYCMPFHVNFSVAAFGG